MPTLSPLPKPEVESRHPTLRVTWWSGEEVVDLQAIGTMLSKLPTGSHMTIQTTEFRTREKRDVVYEPILAPCPDGFTLTYVDQGHWVDDNNELRLADGDLGVAHYQKISTEGKSTWVCNWVGNDNPKKRIEIECALSDEVRDRREVKALVRNAKFRERIFGDSPRCLVTGETDIRVLEAAHICEVKNEGNDSFDNGIVLRADLHKLFDLHILTISSNGRFSMNPVLDSYRYLFNDDGDGWKREPQIQREYLERYIPNIDRRNARRQK